MAIVIEFIHPVGSKHLLVQVIMTVIDLLQVTPGTPSGIGVELAHNLYPAALFIHRYDTAFTK
jgi:hypothetical protein